MFEKYKKAIKIERTGDTSYMVYFLLPFSNITTTITNADNILASISVENASNFDQAEDIAFGLLLHRLKDFTKLIDERD